MGRIKSTIVAVACLIAIASCSSTGIIPMDAGTHMIAQRSAQVGFGPPNGVKADVYKDANDFCGKEGKTVKTIKLETTDSGFARPASVSLTFSCE